MINAAGESKSVEELGSTETTASIIAKLGGADGKIGAEVLPEPLALTEVPRLASREVGGTWASTISTRTVNSENTEIVLVRNNPNSDLVWSTTGFHTNAGGPGQLADYAVLERITSAFGNNPRWRLMLSDGNGFTIALWETVTTSELNIDNIPPFSPAFRATGSPTIALERSAVPTETSVVGQSAIVAHGGVDTIFDLRTEWVAVSPINWVPRTAGIIRNRTTHKWERTFIANGTIQTEILPNQ
jgi:outer membrane protein assembly factor BamB